MGIILASSSNIRQQILKKSGIKFIVIPPTINETSLKNSLNHPTPSEIAITCAKEKALSISKSYPNDTVIGADQVCTLNNKVFSKPITKKRAIQQLTKLSGHTHQLISGICIANKGIITWSHTEITNLSMRTLSLEEITDYVEKDSPLYSCGAYKFESLGHTLFESVSGTSDAIQGLPLKPLLELL